MVCRQLEELQGFRANAAGERAGDDLVVDMARSGGAGDCTRVGETAHMQKPSVKYGSQTNNTPRLTIMCHNAHRRPDSQNC